MPKRKYNYNHRRKALAKRSLRYRIIQRTARKLHVPYYGSVDDLGYKQEPLLQETI
jgi:hypothetical protein